MGVTGLADSSPSLKERPNESGFWIDIDIGVILSPRVSIAE